MNLNQLFENISADQRRVGQLPANFKAPDTSPQLSGPYPGRNATRGYLVGEAAGEDSTAQRVADMLRQTHPNPSEATEREILAAISRVLSDQGMRDVQVRFYLRDPDFQSDIIEAVQALLQGVSEKIDLGPRLGTKRDQGKILRKMRQSRLGEQDVVEAMKPSDIPPTMRQRLTMKDIEAERPAGAYRFRVTFPDGATADFMDFEAAQQRAAADRGRISRLREEKNKSNPRIERILKMLRARHPQAEDDLEALIYDFRSQQSQDRSDIARLDAENDAEEADIERLERMLDLVKQRRGAEAMATESLRDGEYHVATVTLDDGTVKKVRITSDEGFRDQIQKHFQKQGRQVQDIEVDYAVRSQFDENKPGFTGAPVRPAPAPLGATRTLPPAPGRPTMTGRPGTDQERRSIEQDLARRMAAEDVLGDVKRRLGDVLRQRQQQRAERMPQRQAPQDVLGDPVKKIDLGDGNTLMIHGNEDDGFRIHLGKRVMPTRFATLEQAEIATAMFEAKRDACYNKVKSRYKVWPSAYASGALVQCRKQGAANWGKGSKD